MNTNENKAIELWNSKWTPETHTTEYAAKRIKSAQSAKLTPVLINTDDMYGYFQGAKGRYETFLDYCPCGDFHRSKLPCKHIYRLAAELGVLNIPVKSNANAIPIPEKERISLDETIEIIEKLSDDAQKALLTISSGLNSSYPTCSIKLDKSVTELLESGIIVDAAPQEHIIDFGSKKEITKLLDNENITYNKKATKYQLEETCLQYIRKKAEEAFGWIIIVGIPKEFRVQKIHYYLHRKYDYYYDFESGLFTQIQLLDTELPDDDVTNQLIKHGYYSRHK